MPEVTSALRVACAVIRSRLERTNVPCRSSTSRASSIPSTNCSCQQANQALVDSTSELSRAWFTCWQEQFAEGMELTREMLERQGTFVRSSLERLNAQATRSAEVTSGMVDGYFAPLRESAGKVTERATRPAP